jgi:hypothetical protein
VAFELPEQFGIGEVTDLETRGYDGKISSRINL